MGDTVEKDSINIIGWRVGPFVIEKRISLTAAVALLASLSALIGGWYSFDYRINQNTKDIQAQSQQLEDMRQTQERTRDTLDTLNKTIGQLNQRMDDSKVGSPLAH